MYYTYSKLTHPQPHTHHSNPYPDYLDNINRTVVCLLPTLEETHQWVQVGPDWVPIDISAKPPGPFQGVYVYMHLYVCVYAYIHIYIHTYILTWVQVCTNGGAHRHLSQTSGALPKGICMYTSLCMCVCIYTYIHIYIYTYIHTWGQVGTNGYRDA